MGLSFGVVWFSFQLVETYSRSSLSTNPPKGLCKADTEGGSIGGEAPGRAKRGKWSAERSEDNKVYIYLYMSERSEANEVMLSAEWSEANIVYT